MTINYIEKGVEMKKVKIFLTAIIMTLASALITACSCSETEFTPVYETDIGIECTTPSVYSLLDDESGNLTIKCYKGERFTIRYTLSPSNATTTQVDWDFSRAGVLTCSTNSYSKGTVESITFTAFGKGETVITFTTHTTGKSRKASVTVFEEKSKLDTLPTPSNFGYDATTNTVSWGNITSKGLAGYSLNIQEYKIDSNGVPYIDTTVEAIEKEVKTNSYSGFEIGKTYGIKVTAIGDDYEAKTGEQSKAFIFHQLAMATIDSVQNGQVSFTSPAYGATTVVSCDGVSDQKSFGELASSVGGLGGTSHNFDCSYFGDSVDKYNFSIVTYPKNYDIDNGQTRPQNNIYFYPSNVQTVPTITRLSAPTLSLTNIAGKETIDGVTFNTASKETKLNLQGKDQYENLNVKYQYFIFSKSQVDGDEAVALQGIGLDDNNKEVAFGNDTVKVFIVNDHQMTLSSTGRYVYVRMVGDIASTIGSEWKKVEYKQLGRVMASGGVENDAQNISISNNIIKVEMSSSYLDRVEFYFVNKDNSANSRVVLAGDDSICEYNIASLSLASGSYSIYAKLIGKETTDDNLFGGLTGSLYTQKEIATVKVLKATEEVKMSSDGKIKFKGVSYMSSSESSVEIGNYTFNLLMEKSNGDTIEYTMPLNINATWEETKEGDKYVTPLTKEGNYYTFDFYDVMRAVRASDGTILPFWVEDNDVCDLLRDYENYTVTIIANSNGEGEEAVISSKPSAEMKFGRVSNIESFELVDGKKITFTGVNATGYVVIVNGVSSAVYSPLSSTTIAMDLSALRTSSGDKTMFEVIGQSLENVTIEVYGKGREATTDNRNGMIDSFKTLQYFGFSGTPTTLSMNESGELSWIARASLSTDTTYSIKFYSATNSSLIDTRTVSFNDGVKEEESRRYTLDISTILSNHEGQKLYMIVSENVPECFEKGEGAKFYAMKLTTTNVTRAISGDANVVSWGAIAGATGYSVICSSEIFGSGEEKSNTIKVSATSYQIPQDLAEGNYSFTIVVYATNEETSGHSESKPYIISSSSEQTGDNNPTTTVIVASGLTSAFARGENVVWVYNKDYTYAVSYKSASAGSWNSLSDENITTTEGRLEKSFSLAGANAGDYTVKIEAGADYVNTGVILNNKEKESLVTKLETVTSVATSSGRLSFALSESLKGEEDKITFEIYDNESLVDGSLYTITVGEVCYVDFKNTPSSTMSIAIKVKVEGKIDSKPTTPYSLTKIANVNGFERSGDYLKWSAVEHATGYVIVEDGTEKSYRLKASSDESGFICQIVAEDNSTTTNDEVFKYEGGLFVFKPDELVAGAHTYSISATTDLNGYINGNSSSITVTKLHNEVEITIGLGVFEYGYYEVAEGEQSPVQVVIKIYRLKEKDSSAAEGEETQGVSENGYEIDSSYEPIIKTISYEDYSSYATADGGKYVASIFGIANFTAQAQYGTTIKFVGDGASVIDSDESALCSASKISPVSVSTADGMITWEGQNGATYSVEIGDESGVVATFDIAGSGSSIKLPAGFTEGLDGVSGLSGSGVEGGSTSEGEQEGNDEIDVQSLGATFNYIAGIEYSIRVSAKVSGNLRSEWSSPFKFKKLLAISNLNLEIRDVTGISEPALTWTNLNTVASNAYSISIGYYDVETNAEVDGATTSFTGDKNYLALNYDIPVGVYYLRMQAQGNTSNTYGLLASDVSAISSNCKVTYIANDTMPEVKNGKVSWLPLDSAFAYKVTLTNDNTTNKYSTYTSANELDLNSLDVASAIRSLSGYWDIQVTAITNPKEAMISKHIDTKSEDTTATYRPGELKDFKIKDGKLSWTISYEEINAYMDRVEEPKDEENGEGESAGGEETLAMASETQSTFGDASTLIPYIKDMAVRGESTETIYSGVNLQHFYKVKLNIGGIVVEVSPNEARTINDSGVVVDDDKTGTKIEFSYDVEITSDYGGKYAFSVGALGSESVLDGIGSGVIEAYKLATPTSWYDGVENKVPIVDEDGNPKTDEEGNQLYETVVVNTDIKNGRALWQLIIATGSDGKQYYYKKYTLTASSKTDETNTLAKITVTEDDSDILDQYKYSKDLKELFYSEESEFQKVKLDTIYNLYLQANGTEDSTLETSGVFYLNSNKYAFSDTMSILDTCNPTVEEGNYNWSPNKNSQASKLVIYGPLNYQDAIPNGTLLETENWSSEDYTLKMLAKIRYAETDDESVFEEYRITDESVVAELKDAVGKNKTTYMSYINTVSLGVESGNRSSQYTLTDKDYDNGGYAIFEQEIGNGRGIVDSPLSAVKFAYKLGTTSASRTISKSVSGKTKTVDYWLGAGDNAGMFVWNAVPLANAYRLTLSAVDSTVEDAEKVVLESNIVVRTTYYDLDNSRDYGNTNYEYSLDIVAIRVADIHGGSESTPNYNMVSDYFASDKVDTAKEVSFEMTGGESQNVVIGRYRRLDGPTGLQIDDKGEITWNGGSTSDKIHGYQVSYEWGNSVAKDDALEPKIRVLNNILGQTTIRVKAIADADKEYLNSCYSANLVVVKIAPPEPTVTNGVFGWATDGDQATGQSVTSSNLKIDGTSVSLASTTLQYVYYTEVTVDNYTTYTSTADISKYAVGGHTLGIMYNGTSGKSQDNKPFYIASEEKSYYVSKLGTPTLSHYTKDTNTGDGNKIYWNMIDGAEGYKLKFFVVMESGVKVYTYIINMKNRTITIDHPDWSKPSEVSLESSWSDNEYFAIVENDIVFKIENLLGNNGVGSETSGKGLEIRAFVQAIGTLASSSETDNSATARDYLSSSYSDGVPVSIPSAPKSASYDSTTGTLSWRLTTPSDADKNYNILLVAVYKVEGLSSEDISKWIKTAEMTGTYASAPNFTSINPNQESDLMINTRDSDIEERVVLTGAGGGNTTIWVRDTIIVESINNKMPLSYKLKTIATYESIKLTTTAYKDSKDGVYKSSTFTFTGDGITPIEFKLFSAGNGSSILPYEISSEVSLKCVNLYSDRYFKITKDIPLSSDDVNGNWNIINNFSGNLDGGNHLISNVRAILSASEDGNSSYMSFIKDNSGTIKNLKLQVNYSTSSEANDYLVGGVAINNSGTIDNVHIVPLLKESNGNTDYDNSVASIISVTAKCAYAYVGGLVVNNDGTISNSSVLADIKVLVNNKTNSSSAGYVGGVACKVPTSETKSASIENSCFKAEMNGDKLFSGSITANNIGGILERNEGEVSITRCFVDKNVVLTLTDRTNGDTNYKTAGSLGGIVGRVNDSITIDTCYSLATVRVDIGGSSNSGAFAIGGIVGDYDRNSPMTITITDAYAIINCSKASGSKDANIKLYAIIIRDTATSATLDVTNCYYTEDNNGISIDSNTYGERKILDALKTSVSSEKYDTSGTYPTIKNN